MGDVHTTALECPQCGAVVGREDKYCAYCKAPVFVTKVKDLDAYGPKEVVKYIKAYQDLIKNQSGETVETYTALGVCHLKKGLYDAALKYFEQAINLVPVDGEPYYLASLALLKGKRPFLHTLGNIKKVMSYLEAAVASSEEGRYYYLLYLVQSDFYDKKRLRNGKSAKTLRQQALACGVGDDEIEDLESSMNFF